MNQAQFKILRSHFQSLSKDQRIEYLKNLDKKEQLFFYQNPDLFLFDKQIIPDGDWSYYLLRCGRAFGKSYAGSAWIAKKIRGGAKVVGLCGPTYDDVSKIMVPAILAWFTPSEVESPAYNHQTHTVRFKNGAVIYCHTSDKEIRGHNMEYLWCDEICVWSDGIPDKIKQRYEDLIRNVRAGIHPQIIITSTPKSHDFFLDFQEEIDKENPAYQMLVGTMFDNPFLPNSFVKTQLDKYGKTQRGRQEIYGELITEDPEAMFQREWIETNRIVDPDNKLKDHTKDIEYFFKQVIDGQIILKRMVISVDPSGSAKKTSDETGIVVLAQDMKNEVYVLYDLSGRHSADEWSKVVRNAFIKYNKMFPTRIVAETNFGGEAVITNITAVDHSLRPFISEIKASKSKMIRAEVSAAKYQRSKIHHVGHFDKLERQMCNYTGPRNDSSPDRMDALVHGINELLVVPQYTNRDIRILQNF